ncbi:hypothetical protein QL285_042690 [Trifolium repens]|nr:hypothetical protein QL285_042690 [Trifolium repens]
MIRDGFRSSPATTWCCAISAVDFYCTVAVDIKILLMDGCDEHWMKNRREQTGEDPDPYGTHLTPLITGASLSSTIPRCLVITAIINHFDTVTRFLSAAKYSPTTIYASI